MRFSLITLLRRLNIIIEKIIEKVCCQDHLNDLLEIIKEN